MKILIINTFYYPDIEGGAEISVKKLAENLAIKGHDVNVLCTNDTDKYEEINGVKVNRIKINNLYSPGEHRDIPKLKKILYRTLDLYNFLNIKKLEDVIRKINPDVIHINNIYGLSTALWTAIKALNIPIVHTLRDFYLICPKVNLLKEGGICENPRGFCKMYCKFNKKFISQDAYVTAPSKSTLDIFKRYDSMPNKNIKVIYNAIDYDKEKCNEIYNEKMNRKSRTIKYVFVGGLEVHKGIKWLLDVFSSLQDKEAELHIAGKGSKLEMVNEFAENNKNIIYHGFLSEAELNKLLISCDVMVVPSIWYEPFGRVVIDGYKNVLPVIGSNMGGIGEIIDDKITGSLVKANDYEELRNSMIYFNDRNNIKKYLANCIKKLDEFSIEKQVESFELLYKEMLKGK